MNLKKIDNRIRVIIENGVMSGHRSLFVIVGDKGKDQVVILYHMLSKAAVRTRPTVLWCYKKELGFSSHRKKRMKKLQKKIQGGKLDLKEDDPFELFVAATNIRYTYYSETHKILGNTFGMCVLQDFEALTPNLLARTIETVEGGGIIAILLRSMSSLKQLYTMTMDVHARYRTEAHADVAGRFNERFILSLATCHRCLIMDDQLTVLPLSSHSININPLPPKNKDEALDPSDIELSELKESLRDTQPVGCLVNLAKTLDQAKSILKFIEAISEKTLRSTVALTAARGRGKSAALGLAIASAVAFGYSNIFVTSPSPENLKTLFEFIFKGFDALEYQEHLDYDLIQSTNPEFNKAVVRVNIFREHRQTIQYIHPSDSHKLGQSELVVIDEAAAIPLPLVRNLLGPYLVFMASTINGYEGTGRSLSLKLIHQLRQQASTYQGATTESQAAANMTSKSEVGVSPTGRTLHEIQLSESIRYKPGDSVEKWLNELLCLDATIMQPLHSGCPPPQDCDLYYVNRDTLFCFHKASEAFLQRLVALFVASHYKNSPNDLQLMSDAPAHHIFCLLGPVDPTKNILPEILCAVQVCLEGEISRSSIFHGLSQGQRASGDLIPWTLAQQFQDNDFPSLSGVRVVRIATHPDYQKMGYGSRTLELLQKYYEGKIPSLHENESFHHAVPTVDSESVKLLEEKLGPRQNLPPLLAKLSERPAEKLDYLGVSYGLTSELLRFWKKSGYTPVYLRQTANDLTGEHTCIMLKLLNDEEKESSWLTAFWADFRRRFLCLLAYQFSVFKPALALNILQNKNVKEVTSVLTKNELDVHLTTYDIKRLELYSQNMVDYHLIVDLLPAISRLYFLNKFDIHISGIQAALLLAMGLQHKTADDCAKDIDLPTTQLLGLFNRVIRKIVQVLNKILEQSVEETLIPQKHIDMQPLQQTIEEELSEAAKQFQQRQKQELEKLKDLDLSRYAITGSEDLWKSALQSSKVPSIVSIASQGTKRKEKHKKEKQNSESVDKKKKKKKHK